MGVSNGTMPGRFQITLMALARMTISNRVGFPTMRTAIIAIGGPWDHLPGPPVKRRGRHPRGPACA